MEIKKKALIIWGLNLFGAYFLYPLLIIFCIYFFFVNLKSLAGILKIEESIEAYRSINYLNVK